MKQVKTNQAKKWQGSKWIRPEKRLAIYIRDGFRCLCCGRDLRGAKPEDIGLDHLDCRSNGGNNESSNLATICKRDNSARGNKPWTKYYPKGSHARVRNAVRRNLNLPLAKAIIAGEASFDDLKFQH
jgi:5-methylcytosine-specific restriction endonuclease McrA